jgi:hypothetical protein
MSAMAARVKVPHPVLHRVWCAAALDLHNTVSDKVVCPSYTTSNPKREKCLSERATETGGDVLTAIKGSADSWIRRII